MTSHDNANNEPRRKVVVVGDGFCGKTCMLLRYTKDEFPDNYIPTVCEATTIKVQVDERSLSLVLWDTAGQEDYDRLRPLCYSRTQVVLVCFAVDARTSFENVELKWMPEVRHFCPVAPVVLVATKIDLRQGQGRGTVTAAEGWQRAEKIGTDDYVECSSKTRVGINLVFETAARAALKATECNKKKSCVVL